MTFVKALRATKVYSIPKGYFSTATSKSRADMQSAKSMFRRECDEHSQKQTKRARNIQQGIKTEQESCCVFLQIQFRSQLYRH